MEVSGQHYAQVGLPLGKNTSTHLIGGWVGPRSGLDILQNRENPSMLMRYAII